MKEIVLILSVLAVAVPSIAYAHGGGCRKADRPQCCHMDNRTGTVHCH